MDAYFNIEMDHGPRLLSLTTDAGHNTRRGSSSHISEHGETTTHFIHTHIYIYKYISIRIGYNTLRSRGRCEINTRAQKDIRAVVKDTRTRGHARARAGARFTITRCAKGSLVRDQTVCFIYVTKRDVRYYIIILTDSTRRE